jgi:hypothetical protein
MSKLNQTGQDIPVEPDIEDGYYIFVFNNPLSAIDELGLHTLRSAADQWATRYRCAHLGGSRLRSCQRRNWRELSDERKFNIWYREEMSDTSWISNLSDRKCPAQITKCSVGRITSPVNGGSPVLEIVPRFLNPDPSKWYDPALPNWRERNLHPGGPSTIWSMRSKPVAGHANQCIYDDDGALVRSAPTAGTVDYVGTGFWTGLSHYNNDVEPIYLANKLDGGASDYGLPSDFPEIRIEVGIHAARYFKVRPLYAE